MSRFHKIAEKLDAYGLDAMMVTSSPNRLYATQFHSSAGVAVVTREKSYFFTDSRYIEAAGKRITGAEIRQSTDSVSLIDLTNEVIKACGIQKLGFVPEAQNDMIFSIICEELGLVGASFIVLLFLILIWRFFVIATRAKDLLGALIASGAMAHMMIQVILNIAVVTNSIPNTGITLPFISYGGTSVLFLLLEMGLVLSVSVACGSAGGKP